MNALEMSFYVLESSYLHWVLLPTVCIFLFLPAVGVMCGKQSFGICKISKTPRRRNVNFICMHCQKYWLQLTTYIFWTFWSNPLPCCNYRLHAKYCVQGKERSNLFYVSYNGFFMIVCAKLSKYIIIREVKSFLLIWTIFLSNNLQILFITFSHLIRWSDIILWIILYVNIVIFHLISICK